MTQPPELSEDDKKLARIFKEGLKAYDAEKAEEEAKLNASKGGNDSGTGDGDGKPKRSWRERLLG